jgi:peptidoglycan/xylan/chitin deacetylase (PgdA/CDA1 family)
MLKLFEEYDIPITWATVGHLFLSTCKKGDHDWMHRIPYFENRNWKFGKGDWFDCDPYSSWEKASSWYAPDLIEKILNSKVKHEIGCHTFTHIDFSDKNCPPEVAEDEIKACIEVANKWGLSLKSMVFPGGTYGNINILKKYGFQIYRRNINYDLAYPFKDEVGIIISPTSTSFGNNNFEWTVSYFIRRFKMYIDVSIKNQVVCHIWFHPSIDTWFLKNIMPEVLRYAAQKRTEGQLWIGTMEQIAEQIQKTNI